MESQHHRYKSASASASAASVAAAAANSHRSSHNRNSNTANNHGFIASLSADRSFISPTTAAAHFRAATPSGRRRTLPELPMTPSLPSPSYSQRSAQSDPKSVWSKSPYNRYNYAASSNQSLSQSLDGGGGFGSGRAGYASALAGGGGSSMLHRYSSVPKLGSSKYRDHAAIISRSFDNFSSPTPGISGVGSGGGAGTSSSIWLRPGSPFRNPSLYDRIRSRDHALAKMYRNYLSNNDLVQRYSQSQPGSPLRNRFEFGVGRSSGGGGFGVGGRPDPFSSRSYRDLVESSKLRYDLTGSPASSSGYASWRGDLPVGEHHNPLQNPLHRGRFGELSSVLAGSPTPSMSPARNQRLREIMARSNANYYNMRESYNRLHQIGPSPPMSPLGSYNRYSLGHHHRPSAYSSASGAYGGVGGSGLGAYSRSLLLSDARRDLYFDDKDPLHGGLGGYSSGTDPFSSPTYDRYLSGGDLSLYEPSLLRRHFILDMMRLLFRSEFANLVYSPYALQTILAMLIPGAGGNTRAELIRGLFDPMADELCDAESLVHKFATMNRVVTRRNSSCLMVTNFIYVDQRKNLNPAYMEVIRSDFSALAKSVNFADRMSTAKTINTDVYRSSKGLIPELLRPFELPERGSVALVNTVYMKSFWADHCSFFTNGRRFRCSTGKAVFTKFMIRKGRLMYCYDPELRTQVVQLDYANPHLALTLLLPDDEYLPITTFVADYLTMSQFDRLLENLHQDYVDLVLPEFKLSLTHGNLIHQLKCLGIRDVFDESRADLHRMLGTYSRAGVSKVLQKVVVEVNASGRASGLLHGTDGHGSLSLLDMEMQSNPRRSPQYQEFHADRPFLFALTSTEGIKKEILMMGVILDPTVRC